VAERSALPILIRDGTRSVQERVEPLEAHLATLLRSLITQSEDAFLILERPDDPDHYAQVALEEESDFQVEFRDGGPEQHYAAITDDADLAAHVLAGRVDRIDGWDGQLQWERLRLS
jgi:hypothetical protein